MIGRQEDGLRWKTKLIYLHRLNFYRAGIAKGKAKGRFIGKFSKFAKSKIHFVKGRGRTQQKNVREKTVRLEEPSTTKIYHSGK